MDVNPTVNSILDFFVPDPCRNDWRNFNCLELTQNNNERQLRISYGNHQYAFKVDAWDPETQRCVVVCTNSPCGETIARNDRANLTWVFMRLIEMNTPAAPSMASRMWSSYFNAQSLRADDWDPWADDVDADLDDVLMLIPPMPLMAPQLLHG
jgi:hypothetical protein